MSDSLMLGNNETGDPIDTAQADLPEKGDAGAEVLAGQAGEALIVNPPAPGESIEYATVAGQTYILNFPPGDAQVQVEGQNLVLNFDGDGDGTADGRLVFLDLVTLAEAGAAPDFQIAGVDVSAEALLGQSLVLAGAIELPEPPIVGAGEIGSGGASVYSDDLGSVLDLLVAQGVIPPVELQFGLIDLEPEILLLADDEENAPPLADEVVTSADRGNPPPALLAAMAAVDGDGTDSPLDLAESDAVVIDDSEGGGGLPEILLFKQLLVDGDIGDDDNGEVADFGGSDAETPLELLVFTLETAPAFGQLILVTAGGETSSLLPGDTYSSADTVWWVTTQSEVDDFMRSEELNFLPEAQFLYSVTDAEGASAQDSVTINLPPLGTPSTELEQVCIPEDTEGTVYFSADPNDSLAKITQIVISGFPTGGPDAAWTVDADSVDFPGYTLGTDFTAVYDPATGELTVDFTLSSFPLGESLSGSVNVTPNPDSDVDAELVIQATASNGSQTLAADAAATAVVDAVVDGSEVEQTAPAEGETGSEIALNLEIDLGGDSTTGPGESQGGTDTDGSESVTNLVVTLSLGALGWVLPASIAAPTEGPDGTWTFDTSGAELGDVQALVSSLSVTAPDDFEGDGITATVTTTTAEAATVAGPNGDSGEECDDSDNVDVDDYQFAVTVTPGAGPVLIVGENVDDDADESTPHRVHEPTSGQDYGEIIGDSGPDVLIGDVGGGSLVNKTMNLALILDTSGSMGEVEIDFNGTTMTRIEALDLAVEQMLDKIVEAEGATVRLHMVSFATDVDDETGARTFDIVTDGVPNLAALQAAKDFVLADGDVPAQAAAGDTNYEAGFQAALDWFQGNGIPPGETILDNPNFNKTVFVSDGLPNRFYVGDQTVTTKFTPDPQKALDHLLGQFDAVVPVNDDTVNEFGALLGEFNGVKGTVDAIGINTDLAETVLLSQADEGEADSIVEGEELANVLNELTQAATLAAVGDDVIVGGGGADLIFGDSIYTDILADDEGIADPAPGDGWSVIENLKDSLFDSDPAKTTEEEIMDFLRDPANQDTYDFGRESLVDGVGRAGGNDTIDGGGGDDLIFGQEGDDVIDGGSGEDTIIGGSGDDIASGGDGTDTFAWGSTFVAGEVDTITDFNDGGGSAEVLDFAGLLVGEDSTGGGIALDAFLEFGFDGTDTTVEIDANGDGSGTDVTIVLQGIDLTGGSVDQVAIINSLLGDGTLVTD